MINSSFLATKKCTVVVSTKTKGHQIEPDPSRDEQRTKITNIYVYLIGHTNTPQTAIE